MATPQKSNSSKKKRSKWKPQAGAEARRLGNTEGDWNLAGSIGSRRSNRTSSPAGPRDLFGEEVKLDDDAGSSAASSLTASTSTNKRKKKKLKYWKPPSTRVILEVNPVKQLLEKYLESACPVCGSALLVTFPYTSCVASGCRITCANEVGCTYVDLVGPATSNIPLADDASEKIKRNSDSALNVLYVVAFIASGDGGAEASRLLGLLGLPNSTTMQGRSFGSIERQIGPTIREYTNEIILENIKEEVKLVYGDNVDTVTNRKLYDLWLEDKVPIEQWPRVDGCADMGWQQKGSGRLRNSKSGHALIFAMRTRRAIALTTCSKACGYCKTWYTRNTMDEAVPPHKCFINHEGTSGSMEPIAVLRMYIWLYQQRVIVQRFVADDDSSMKAKLKWSNDDYKVNTGATSAPKIVNKNGNLTARPNHGRVPRHMPEPLFVADPNHRRKTLSNFLWKLALTLKTSPQQQRINYDNMVERKQQEAKEKGKDPPVIKPFKVKAWNYTMTKMDARRISKNFAFMARSLQYKTTDNDIVDAGKAVLEHHFDCHDYCNISWCRRKVYLEQKAAAAAAASNEEDKEDEDDKNGRANKFYRDKTLDAELYKKLQSIIARFITLEALKELAHNMDTCANESFNNTASWIAPKNRVYCGTDSLRNRLSIALGISTKGILNYYEGLFERMGIAMTDDVLHFLKMKSGGRDRRLQATKTKEFKEKRRKHEFDKIKKESAEALAARVKREGIYQPGIGMEGGYTQADFDDAAAEDDAGDQKPAATSTKKTTKANAKNNGRKACICGGTDHQRTSSKKCLFHGQKKPSKAAVLAPKANVTTELIDVDKDMADEMDALDSLAVHPGHEDYYTDTVSIGESDDEGFFSATSEFS